jgi:fructosamine-3-kinase
MNDATTTVISKAVRAHCGESVVAITKLHGGVVNQVFSVATEHHRYVLRLNQDSLAVFLKEQWAMAQASKKQVRVPQVFVVGETDGISYMLMEQAPGVMLSQYSGDRERAFVNLGAQVRRLHQIQVEGYGFDLDLTDIEHPRFREDWAEVIRGEHEMTFANPSLLEMGALNQNQIEAAIEFLKPMAMWQYPAMLCHGDLNLSNVLVDENGEVTILDWTGAKGGPALLFDLSGLSMKNPAEFAAFCHGYGLSNEQRSELKSDWQRIALKDVLRAAAWGYSVKHEQLAKFAADVQEIYRKIFPGSNCL